jgi:mono/diheme cytochrome c family protein
LDNSEHAWHHPDGQIQELTINGGNMMPAFGDKLGDEEIKAVIRYLQTWWTAEQFAAQQKAGQSNPFR